MNLRNFLFCPTLPERLLSTCCCNMKCKAVDMPAGMVHTFFLWSLVRSSCALIQGLNTSAVQGLKWLPRAFESASVFFFSCPFRVCALRGRALPRLIWSLINPTYLHFPTFAVIATGLSVEPASRCFRFGFCSVVAI